MFFVTLTVIIKESELIVCFKWLEWCKIQNYKGTNTCAETGSINLSGKKEPSAFEI